MRESEDWLDIYITSSRQHPTNASSLLSFPSPELLLHSFLPAPTLCSTSVFSPLPFSKPPSCQPTNGLQFLAKSSLSQSSSSSSKATFPLLFIPLPPHSLKEWTLPIHVVSRTLGSGPWADRGGRKKYVVTQPLSPRRMTNGLGVSVGCLPQLLNFNLLSSFSQPANSPILRLLLELSGKVTKSQGLSSVLILCLSKLYHWSLPFQHTHSSAKSPLKLLTHSHRASDFTFVTKHL